MKDWSKAIITLAVAFGFLFTSSMSICDVFVDSISNTNEFVCELNCDGKITKYDTVKAAVDEWDENGFGDCIITIYKDAEIKEDPIHIEQKGTDPRTLSIEGAGNVKMKCSGVDTDTDGYPCVFYITAQSDFTQTPSLTFKNITFDMSEMTKASYGIYSKGVESQRYIRGISVESCTFIGNQDRTCAGVGTRHNGSADFKLVGCVGNNLHTLFNGYSYIRTTDYGLTLIDCISTNGKYFVNNQAASGSTYIKDCVADYVGSSDDSYGVRTKGNNLYMDNVHLTYKGEYASKFDAFVVAKGIVSEISLNKCSFRGFDDVTESCVEGENKKDVYIDGNFTVGKLVIDGKDTPMVQNKFYNFPRYIVEIKQNTGGTAEVSDGHHKEVTLKAMKNAKLTLGYTPAEGYVFDKWDTSDVVIDAFNQFVMVGKNVVISPIFKHPSETCTVTVNVDGNIGDHSKGGVVEKNSDFVFFAVANEDYKVKSVLVDGTEKGVAMFTLTITQDTSIEVTSEYSEGTRSEKYENSVIETNTVDTDVGTKEDKKVTYIDGTVERTITIECDEGVNTKYESGRDSLIVSSIETTEFEDVAKVSPELFETAMKQIDIIVKDTTIKTISEISIVALGEDQKKTEFQMPCGCISSMEDELTVIFESSSGSITMDSGDLKKLTETAGREDILILTVGIADESELSEKEKEFFGDNTVIFAEARLNDLVIHNLNGDVTVTMPVEPKEGESYEIVTVYYFDEDTEESEKFDASYDPEKKLVSFVTGHFSHFVVFFGDHPGPEPGPTPTPTPEPTPEPYPSMDADYTDIVFIVIIAGLVIALFGLAFVIRANK